MALAKMSWDELNRLVGYKKSEPIDEFFNPMQISDKQKEKRIALAKDLYNIFVAMLVEIFEADQFGIGISDDLFERTREAYMQILEGHVDIDTYLIEHCIETISEAIDVLERHSNEPYYYSDDRAIAISENDANSIMNYDEYDDALSNYHFKTWNTIMDGRERDSHAEVNGVTIPITEPFELAGGLLQFPLDTSLDCDSSEIANCRCSCSFS